MFLILENITALLERFKALLRHLNIRSIAGITFGLKSLLEALKGFYGAFLLCIGMILFNKIYCLRIVVFCVQDSG